MMRNDYHATAKDQSNYYVHWPVAVGRLILLQCDGGEMTMMRVAVVQATRSAYQRYDARCLIQITMMRNDYDARRLIQMRRRSVLW